MIRVARSFSSSFWMRLAVIVMLLPCMAQAQLAEQRRLYVFGQESMHPPQDNHRMTVWLDRLARAAGHSLAAEGRSGDLRRFAFELPARAEWDMAPLTRVLGPDKPGFRLAGFDTVILSPEVEVLEHPPHDLFAGVNRAGHSPVTVSTMVLDWLSRYARGARILIRQDIAAGGAVDAADDWHAEYLAALREARPMMAVQGIPLYRGLPRMRTLVGEEAAAHPVGRAFLEALLTYGAVYSEAPPLQVALPEDLPEEIRAAYPALVRLVLPILADYPETLELPPLIGPEGLENPSLAMGLNTISDWSAQQPFLDLVKSARVWSAHRADGGPVIELPEIADKAAFDEQGWPIRMPEGADWLSMLMLTDQPADGYSRAGRYVLTWEGQGQIAMNGVHDLDSSTPGEVRFSYVPYPGLVEIRVLSTDPAGTGDYIRNIRVVREEHLPLQELGVIFNPDWLRHVRDLRLVRFMDWMGTNGSTRGRLADGPFQEDFTYSWRGVPVEVMVDLANEIGADAWFNVPHLSDDAYVTRLAEVVRDRMDPRLRAYVEYSNEIWNFIFPQTHWAREQAMERWGPVKGDGDGWMQFAGMRAAQVAQIWTDVFGDEAETRLVRVLGVHPGWFGLEEPLMYAPLWVEENPDQNRPPHTYFDAYGVTGYIALMGEPDEKFPRVLSWLDEGEEVATQRLTEELRAESLHHLRTENYPYHASVARKHGLDLVMYEGGTHVVAYDKWVDNDRLNSFFMRFNYTPEMALLYAELFDIWQEAGGTFFNAFLDVNNPTRWGSWGHLRHLDDINPRWLAVMAQNATAPVDWEERAPGTFSHGTIRMAAPDGGQVEARHPRDILLGGDGDDILVATGCCTRLHGGAGRNVAVLPGVAADYVMHWQGNSLLANNESGEIRMVNVQALRFSEVQGESVELTPGIQP